MARYHRLAGDDVWLLTGTDEHGDKIAQAAAKAGVSPQALRRPELGGVPRRLGRAGHHATTTSSARPRPGTSTVVQAILQKLWDAGEIYLGKYGGHYCYGCERFYTEKEIVDGKCPDHLTPLTWIEEENYFFKMSKYQGWLIDYIKRSPTSIRPERYRNEILGFLRDPLQDLSISRPRTPARVGHPAAVRRQVRDLRLVRRAHQLRLGARLARRRRALRRSSGRRVQHLIGKDILKPHAVYWPCMLKAAGLDLYQHLNVHGYWTLGGGKMSKSLGNVVEALRARRQVRRRRLPLLRAARDGVRPRRRLLRGRVRRPAQRRPRQRPRQPRRRAPPR